MASRRIDGFIGTAVPAFLAAAAAIIVLSSYQLQYRDSDIFWALRSGGWIIENLTVPSSDPFSFTSTGRWVDFTWGFQVIARLFFSAMGWHGLFILQLSIVFLTFFFIYRNSRLTAPGHGWLSAAIVVLVLAGAHPRLMIRPHLFAYLFITLYIYLLNLYEAKRRALFLALLIPLQVLWINIHSSAVLGIFITGAWAAGGVIDSVIRRREGPTGPFVSRAHKGLIIIAMLLPIAGLMNPYGLKLMTFPFIHQGPANYEALRHIAEWDRPDLRSLLYLYPDPIDHFAFVLIFATSIISMALNFRRIRTRDLFIFGAAFYMAATHARWIVQFEFFAAPLIVSNFALYLGDKDKGRGYTGAAFLTVSAILAAAVFRWYLVQNPSTLGVGLKKGVYPEGTAEFMKKEGVKANLYNEYDFGGYLIENNPDVKVFIDGRTPTVHSPYLFWQTRLSYKSAQWRRLSDEYSLSAAVVKPTDPLCNVLSEDGSWAAVSFDDASVLYLNRAVFPGVISKYEIPGFDLCAAEATGPRLKPDIAWLKDTRGRLKYAISVQSTPVARSHRALALIDMRLNEMEHGAGYLDEAAAELKGALSINKDRYTWYDYGRALDRLKRYGESEEAFLRAAAMDLNEGYLGAGQELYKLNDFKSASHYLNRYISKADDASQPVSYMLLGLSNFELSDFSGAAAALRKAAYTLEDRSELARTQYYLGCSLLLGGDTTQAVASFTKAIEYDPAYLQLLKNFAKPLKEKGRPGIDAIYSIKGMN